MELQAWLSIVLQGAALFFVGTVVFDLVHWMLHKFADSDWPLLARLGQLHESHHVFLDRDLDIRDEHRTENLVWHVVPEYLTRVLATLPFLWLFDAIAVVAVLGLHTAIFCGVLWGRGEDTNHFATDRLGSPSHSLFVGPDYHLRHHVYPEQFFSSVLRVFDWIAGTACPLEGRRVTMTGSSGAFGEPMADLLKEAGVESVTTLTFGVDWNYDDYAALEEILPETDILVLAHGSKVDHAMEANCESFVHMIEAFRRHGADRSVVPEIWAIGSEIECHPHWGNEELKVYKRSKVAYSRYARHYWAADDLLYRHIVPSAFTSPMGEGLISGRTAAKIALFLIRRGVEYIPVTYTGIALLNYPKFLFGLNAEAPRDENVAGAAVTD